MMTLKDYILHYNHDTTAIYPAKVVWKGSLVINNVHKSFVKVEGDVEKGEARRNGLFEAGTSYSHQLLVARPFSSAVVYRFLRRGRD